MYIVLLVSYCIFEIHQLWQSGFSRVYSNCCCSYLFKPEIIKIGQSSHKIYSNNILNCQESTTILNACTKKSGNLLNAPRVYVCVCKLYQTKASPKTPLWNRMDGYSLLHKQLFKLNIWLKQLCLIWNIFHQCQTNIFKVYIWLSGVHDRRYHKIVIGHSLSTWQQFCS